MGDALKAAAETADENAVHYDAGSDKATVTLAGKDGTTLKNVNAGVDDKDAVNVSQLKDAGLIGDDGKSLAAVTYDGPEKDKVTLAGKTGTTLSNVKAGAADMDAVNVSQLKSSGLIGDDGKSRAAVLYDQDKDGKANYASITLDKDGTTLKNVNAGVDEKDAVNVSQLKDAGLIGDDGKALAAVTYDGPEKDKVTLAGKTGTTLSNVKAGAADMDAVNVSQLKSSGLIGDDGKSRAAVLYDQDKDGNANYASVTLDKDGTTLKNVNAGVDEKDAVNVSQLKDAGLIGDDGKAIAAVTYDGPEKDKVSLAGKDGTTLSNVNAGKADKDAVNVSQLKDAGLIGDGGKALAAVTYDGPAKDRVTFAGTTGTTLSNVNAGTADKDAVNVSQLKSSGLIGDDGKSRAAVLYDQDKDGNANYASITLNKDGTTLKNVNAGVDDKDAVNVSQLKDAGLIGDDGKSVAAVTYDGPEKDKVTLAGKTGTTLSNVKAGAADMDAVNVSQLKSSGLIGDDGKSRAAVLYDQDKDGKANYASVTLGNAGVPVGLHNVAAGMAGTDAVNVSQLTGVTDALGGKAAVGSDGKIKAPEYKVGDGFYDNVGDALEATAKLASGTDPNGVVYDSTKQDKVTLTGKDGTTLSNLNAGVDDKDAVNVSQLKDAGLIGDDGKALAAVTYDGPEKDKVSLAGKDGTTLSNVKAGAADMDAVNVSQLKSSGLIGDDGKSRAAVLYDQDKDGKANYASVTLDKDGTTLKNVNAGVDDKDAVNVSQLKGAGLIGDDGKALAAVTYDGPEKDKVTLAGKDGTTLKNVNAGVDEKDAVNVSQLKDAGLIGDDGKSLAAVTYDGPEKDKVSLAGKDGTTLSNVKAGAADMDAVNVSQLKSSGLIGDDGKSRAAVLYDQDKDGNANYASVTLDKDGTTLKNVNAGVDEKDAVNVSQLKDAGLIGDGGKALAAVTYDGPEKDTVTLAGTAGTTLKNVNAGIDDKDAVNVSQLKSSGLIGDDGKALAAVTYDGPEKDKVSLAGKDGTTLSNVKAGAADMDAVNVSQLKDAGLIGDDGKALSAVTYDADSNQSKVTLAGANGTTLSNVADGVADKDAVNVSQMKSAGLIGDGGKTLAAVTYDQGKDGNPDYSSVTFGKVDTAVGLHNVAAGIAATDAVNVSQLSGVTDAFGGGAKIDPTTGAVVAPTYDIGGNTYHNVGDALTDIDGRVKDIQGNIGDVANMAGMVAYDRNADKTINFGSVTLGNGQSAGPVHLTNVADGTTTYDAVNYGQLSALSDRVDDLDDRLGAVTIPGEPGGGSANNDLISGTGGHAAEKGDVVAANAGNGNGNVAVGSGSRVSDGVNDGTAMGSGTQVKSSGGTAIGEGAKVGSGAENSVALGKGSVANEANTVSVGAAGEERRIVNIADGVNATDAVNKGQMDRAMGGMRGQINDLSKNAYSGIAAATALTMIPGVDPGKNLSFGVAGASYKGYQAVALGGEARITENLKLRAGVGLASGGNTFGVGASYQW
ncbi:YadA-like family protein [Burkholderia sp. 3C]